MVIRFPYMIIYVCIELYAHVRETSTSPKEAARPKSAAEAVLNAIYFNLHEVGEVDTESWISSSFLQILLCT